MPGKRIVLIGAGSMTFTRGLLMDLVLAPHLQGSTVALVDVNEEKLALAARLARQMIAQEGAGLTVEAATDRSELLPDADYVITTISVGGHPAWEKDLKIPLKYGITQTVGDSVGPGGLSRALRHVPVILGVAEDMEELCPEAILFNYTNPMTVICRSVVRETETPVIGLCHGVPNTVTYLAEYMGVPRDELMVRAAGINHMVWLTSLLRSGQDAYPELWDLYQRKGPADRPASFELMELYGLFPGPGHEHIMEFFPWFVTERTGYGAKYGEGLFPIEQQNLGRVERSERLLAEAEGRVPIPVRRSGEDVMEIITAMVTNQPKVVAVNVPNHGAVPDLSDEAVIEVSSLVDGAGIQPLRNIGLPTGAADVLRARLDQQELISLAAVNGDRDLALQALLAEHGVGSVADARAMLDELLAAQAAHLPFFA
jgi:alpha-galactosidase